MDRCVTLIESTSPSSLLSGSLDAARRLAAVRGHELLDETLRGPGRHARARCASCPVSTCSTSGWPARPGVFDYDPLRLVIDVRGTGHSGYALARIVRERDDVNLELAGENVMVAVFGMGEDVTAAGARLVAALRHGVDALSETPEDRTDEPFAPPPPWGELAMTPRETRSSGPRRWCRRARPSGAWPPSRWPPTRPGSRTCCPASGSRPRRSTTSSRRSTTAAACAARATAGCATLRVAVER